MNGRHSFVVDNTLGSLLLNSDSVTHFVSITLVLNKCYVNIYVKQTKHTQAQRANEHSWGRRTILASSIHA